MYHRRTPPQPQCGPLSFFPTGPSTDVSLLPTDRCKVRRVCVALRRRPGRVPRLHAAAGMEPKRESSHVCGPIASQQGVEKGQYFDLHLLPPACACLFWLPAQLYRTVQYLWRTAVAGGLRLRASILRGSRYMCGSAHNVPPTWGVPTSSATLGCVDKYGVRGVSGVDSRGHPPSRGVCETRIPPGKPVGPIPLSFVHSFLIHCILQEFAFACSPLTNKSGAILVTRPARDSGSCRSPYAYAHITVTVVPRPPAKAGALSLGQRLVRNTACRAVSQVPVHYIPARRLWQQRS